VLRLDERLPTDVNFFLHKPYIMRLWKAGHAEITIRKDNWCYPADRSVPNTDLAIKHA